MNLPKSFFMPIESIKFKNPTSKEIKFEEHCLHWSTTKGGTYKNKKGQNKKISLSKTNFLNDLKHLYDIIFTLVNYVASDEYFFFWNSKLHQKNATKDEISWLTLKIISARNSILNSLIDLYYSVHLVLQQITLEENDFDIHFFKRNLIIEVYSIVEAFLVSINSVYLFLEKTGSELTKYDQNLNKLEITIDNIKHSEFLIITRNQSLKDDFEVLSKVRNVIVHPFSLKEGKKDYSYWQIVYAGEVEKKNKLDYSEILLAKMAVSNVKNVNWIRMPKEQYESSTEIEILNLSIRFLEEILKYFKKK